MYDEITTTDLIVTAHEVAHPNDSPSAEHAALIDELAERLARLSVWRERMTSPGVSGISVWLPRNKRPDRFKSKDHGVFHFPCCSCKHASTTESEFCQGCGHYVLPNSGKTLRYFSDADGFTISDGFDPVTGDEVIEYTREQADKEIARNESQRARSHTDGSAK